MKAFDKIGDSVKPDEEFNKKAEVIDKKLVDQKQSIEKEQEDINKGLKIEMRNQTMCPIMRVEFPSEIVEEIKNTPDEDALDAILQKITKTYLKKAYNLEKKIEITKVSDYDPGINTMNHYSDKIKIVMFLDDIGDASITWGSAENFGYGHDLYPPIHETIKSEKGVMLVIPSYADTNFMRLKDYKVWGAKW
tara:strand:- start:44767 stop:45342 length:576 start_codon:yes stop_codon:yes gene_type:complete